MAKAHRILLMIVVCLSLHEIQAQDFNFIGRGNLSIGTAYETLDFGGSSLAYSPGGGIGLELGIQLEVMDGIFLQPTIGYQLLFAIQAESINGVSNRSSFTFNRKFISVGAVKKFELGGRSIVNGLLLGGGSHINFPGTLKRIENDESLGESTYSTDFGFYIEVALRLQVSEDLAIDPGIRYRGLNFTADSFSEGPITDLPLALQNLSSSGIELGVTVAKRIR